MSHIDSTRIKRTTESNELESITLRSDVVSRYLFTTETLLTATGFCEPGKIEDWKLGLKECLPEKKITDENKYLESWAKQLKSQIDHKKQDDKVQDELDADAGYLNERIESMKKGFLNPTDASLTKHNNSILRDYCKKYNRRVYEVHGSIQKNLDEENDDEDDDDDDDDENNGETDTDTEHGDENSTNHRAEDYRGSYYYRLPHRMEIKGVVYSSGKYKKRKLDRSDSSDSDPDATQTILSEATVPVSTDNEVADESKKEENVTETNGVADASHFESERKV